MEQSKKRAAVSSESKEEESSGRRVVTPVKKKRKTENQKPYWKQSSRRFTHGCYKGKTFKEVALADPEYHERYRRALRSKGKKPTGEIAEYIEWHNEAEHKDPDLSLRRIKEDQGNQLFDFGQHNGKTFRQVAQSDPGYIDRYMHKDPAGAQRRLRDYIEYFNNFGQYLPTRQGHHRGQFYETERYRKDYRNNPYHPWIIDEEPY